MNRRKSVIGLVVWLVACFIAARLNAIFPPGEWFDTLVKPSWMPPTAIIGPIWVALYIMMAVSVWLVWLKRHERGAYMAIGAFLLQLAFNAAWSYVFFGLHYMGAAFVEIVLLWLLILATILAFRPYSRAASALLAPYLLWVTVAAALNLSLWRLNS